MLALFTSYVCDWCDGTPQGRFHRGWVAWDDGTPAAPATALVFRFADDAARWGEGRERSLQVREVLSSEAFQWTHARGSLRDLELADRPFQVFRDHRFPDGECRAFLAPVLMPAGDPVQLRRKR